MITHTDDPRLLWYVAGWISVCLLGLGILVHDRHRVHVEWNGYWNYLTMRWKVCSFALAFVFVTFAGRFTDDETWDVITGGGMSLLTFITAPWCVGLLYQVFTGRRACRYLIVALGMTFFSSSWFYDGYLLLRDGSYTTRWWSNLMLSPILYLAGGLFWSLEARGRFGFRFGFVRPDWPSRPTDTRILPILLASIPLVLVAGFILIAFVQWTMPWASR